MTIATLPDPPPCTHLADTLNRECLCQSLSREQLNQVLQTQTGLHVTLERLLHDRPHLFSGSVVFMSESHARHIQHTVQAIESVAALPGYQAQALARSRPIARANWGPLGVCMGYDFHITSSGPKLIEVNTNAGGLLLNGALARAQQACCKGFASFSWGASAHPALHPQFQHSLFDMFANEWHLQRGSLPWRTVLIADQDPAGQYLAPEFELYRQMFANHGLQAMVGDPADLLWRSGRLLYQGQVIDLVYNRLTDFYLEDGRHQALRSAHDAGAVVLTPHPRGHALLADKRNLVVLSQDALLAAWGAPAAQRRALAASVPSTRLVTPERADELWAQRRQYFFKPVAGYGARATYRGDKLTRRVWDEIVQGDFVAQALVPPAVRVIEHDGKPAELKYDVRAFTYGGQVQLLAARLYSGQTTNFRTPGGGFAPIFVVPDPEAA